MATGVHRRRAQRDGLRGAVAEHHETRGHPRGRRPRRGRQGDEAADVVSREPRGSARAGAQVRDGARERAVAPGGFG